MISVLIPTYNYDVRGLAIELSRQASIYPGKFEIIISEDGSDEKFQHVNAEINNYPLINYSVNKNNSGRVGIRLSLAEKAKYDWLLFIDDDSSIIKDDFLRGYLEVISSINEEEAKLPTKFTSEALRNLQRTDNQEVITGGRIYPEPLDCIYRLHWKYGKKREHLWRNNNNRRGFQSNNFLIKKICSEHFLSQII